ncbi:30S ribosomal protein S8 [Patescibacteria group bacterium]|nr:30S ribosomal protein S8 [Patescibacteria group bacterium]
MSVDRLSNMISAIKNSSMAGRDTLELPYSRECEDVAKVLKSRDLIDEVKVFKKENSSTKMLSLKLSRDGEIVKLSQAKRISKPGRRIYRGYKDIKPVLSGLGVLVISTSRGIMDGKEAKKKKLGGEVICEVY